jgi:putative hydrolase of HD superfamily
MAGERIVLRDWLLTDLERYAYWLQPGQRWQELDGPYYPKPTVSEIAEIMARLREEITTGNLADPRNTLVIAERQTNTLIGRVSRYWQSEETNWLSVGIVIYDPEQWGCGIGYEALGLWSQYLFTAMPTLVRLDLRTWSGNVGMMRLAEKLGYREEARFRKARIVHG